MQLGAEHGRANGYHISVEPYADGAAGIEQSVEAMVEGIRGARKDPLLREWVYDVFKEAKIDGRDHPSVLAQTSAILEAFRKQTIYAPDTAGTEHVQKPHVTLCLRDKCIPMEDCESLTCALVAALLVVNLRAFIVHQKYGAGQQEHVLAGVLDESGRKLYADPSTREPVSSRSHASEENWIDPLQPVGSLGAAPPEIITLGAPPRQVKFEDGAWWEMRYGTVWRYDGSVWQPTDRTELPCCSDCARTGGECGKGGETSHVGWPSGTSFAGFNLGAPAGHGGGGGGHGGGGGGHGGGHGGGGGRGGGMHAGGAAAHRAAGHAPAMRGHHPPPHHIRPPHRFPRRRPFRFFNGGWWWWNNGVWVIETLPVCEWGAPLTSPPADLLAEANAQLAWSGGDDVFETWDDGQTYKFSAGPVIQPCVVAVGLGAMPSGTWAAQPDFGVKEGLRYAIHVVTEKTLSDGGRDWTASDTEDFFRNRNFKVETVSPGDVAGKFASWWVTAVAKQTQVLADTPEVLFSTVMHEAQLPATKACSDGTQVPIDKPCPSDQPVVVKPAGTSEQKQDSGIGVAVGMAVVATGLAIGAGYYLFKKTPALRRRAA
jgi:hypothetical protein